MGQINEGANRLSAHGTAGDQRIGIPGSAAAQPGPKTSGSRARPEQRRSRPGGRLWRTTGQSYEDMTARGGCGG